MMRFLLLASLLSLCGCRTAESTTETQDVAALDESPESSVPAQPGAPDDAYRPFPCPAGSVPVTMGLKPAHLDLSGTDLGFTEDSLAKPESVRATAVGVRFDGCKRTASGETLLARVYLRSRGQFGEPRHLTLVIDPQATSTVENIANGTFTLPTAKATLAGVSSAFAGEVAGFSVRLEFADETFPTTFVARSIVKNGATVIVAWTESADGADGASLTGGPIYGTPDGDDPFVLDSVCPYGWFRAGMRYALKDVLLELDACEMTHDLITGEPARGLLYRALRITDSHLSAAASESEDPALPHKQGTLVFPDEAAVARVLTLQAGDPGGCDDLEISLPGAEYLLVTGTKIDDCLVDGDLRSKMSGHRPKGSVGPYKLHYGDEEWQVGWAQSRPAPLPLTFSTP